MERLVGLSRAILTSLLRSVGNQTSRARLSHTFISGGLYEQTDD